MNELPAKIVIVGAGGLAREIRWLLQEASTRPQGSSFVGYAVSDLANPGRFDSADEVVGDLNWLEEHASELDGVVLAVGDPAARARLYAEIRRRTPTLAWPSVVHPSFRRDQASANIGHGAIICAGVTATVNVSVAECAFINLHCTLGHESSVGRFSVINPDANISGGVQIGERVMIGTGAQILQYLSIGDGAAVGAGAVVTRDVAPGETVVGIPAKPLRRS